MTITDPIADMLTRIRNGIKEKHEKVEVPMSRVKLDIVKVLKEEGYIKKYEHKVKGNKKYLKVVLKYTPERENVIHGLERVSRPGRRVYTEKKEIPKVLNGLGISVISTNKGIMTGKSAREANTGGELLCKIW